MLKTYLIVCLGALILGAFFYGKNIEQEKCRVRYLQLSEQNQEQTILKQRKIHDTVYKTGLGDIRRILRDKYTIAE